MSNYLTIKQMECLLSTIERITNANAQLAKGNNYHDSAFLLKKDEDILKILKRKTEQRLAEIKTYKAS
jgi:hypothetical protein